jgi:hypothetical protein
MNRSLIETLRGSRCACGGVLVVQRAAPDDRLFRIVCVSCGNVATAAGSDPRPVALAA